MEINTGVGQGLKVNHFLFLYFLKPLSFVTCVQGQVHVFWIEFSGNLVRISGLGKISRVQKYQKNFAKRISNPIEM